MAKKGTDSVWVLLLTGPLWPWWTGLCHATRGTPFRERTFPPRDSIRVFSDGTSGLWSAVRATAWSFFSLFNRPSAARESPTWAMYRVLPLRITTVAVVPDVLGSPCLVRGQESVDELVRNNRLRVLSLQVLTKLKLWEYWAIGLYLQMRVRDWGRFAILPAEKPHGVYRGEAKIKPGLRLESG